MVGLLLRSQYRRLQVYLLAVAALLLFLGSVGAARIELSYFLKDGERLRQIGHAMHVLAEGEECHGVSRFTPPALQLASGCRVRLVSDQDVALRWLEEAPADIVRFLGYPAVPGLEAVSGWSVMSPRNNPHQVWFRTKP